MIEQEIGKNYSKEAREQYLRNICDGMENISYTRLFTPEELAEQRELLTEASIMLADIEQAKKETLAQFKEKAKPYEEQKADAINNLRTKSEVVNEECFKILDEDTKTIGFYNANGDLVSSRPAFPNELQRKLNIFAELKTGTDDK